MNTMMINITVSSVVGMRCYDEQCALYDRDHYTMLCVYSATHHHTYLFADKYTDL